MFDFESVEKELNLKFENLEMKIVYLYYIEKYSIRQVAKELSCSSQTVKKVLDKNYGVRDKTEALALRSTDDYREKLRITQLGESNSSAKLTEPDVLAIRDIYDNAVKIGKKKYQTELMLANDFGVGRSTISDIVKLRTWKHI